MQPIKMLESLLQEKLKRALKIIQEEEEKTHNIGLEKMEVCRLDINQEAFILVFKKQEHQSK